MEKIPDRKLETEKLEETLAMTRTRLSVERTFLSYIRTALTLIVAGTSLIEFFEIMVFRISGFVFIGLGLLTFVLGYIRFRQSKGKLRNMDKRIAELVNEDY